jgi:hypothetical protein
MKEQRNRFSLHQYFVDETAEGIALIAPMTPASLTGTRGEVYRDQSFRPSHLQTKHA